MILQVKHGGGLAVVVGYVKYDFLVILVGHQGPDRSLPWERFQIVLELVEDLGNRFYPNDLEIKSVVDASLLSRVRSHVDNTADLL
jgi:hypothetical protein